MTLSPLWGNAIGVMLLVFLATFIGIWIWLWQKRHRPTFDRLAALPMEDHGTPERIHANKESDA